MQIWSLIIRCAYFKATSVTVLEEANTILAAAGKVPSGFSGTKKTQMLGMTAIYYLAKKYLSPDSFALVDDSMVEGYMPFTLGPIDHFLVWFAKIITSAVRNSNSGRHFYCANSEGSGSSGFHWVSIVVTTDFGVSGGASPENVDDEDFFRNIPDPEESDFVVPPLATTEHSSFSSDEDAWSDVSADESEFPQYAHSSDPGGIELDDGGYIPESDIRFGAFTDD
jgi:hypothetical protein